MRSSISSAVRAYFQDGIYVGPPLRMMSLKAFSSSAARLVNRPLRSGPRAETQQYLLPPAPFVLARWQSAQRWKNSPAPLTCCSVNSAPLEWRIGKDREADWGTRDSPSCADASVARPTKRASNTAKLASKLIRSTI